MTAFNLREQSKMRACSVGFSLVMFSLHSLCLAERYLLTAECPLGEFYPGPDCSTEPFCSPRHLHRYIARMRSHSCLCWCLPGTYRDLLTGECHRKCPKDTIDMDEK